MPRPHVFPQWMQRAGPGFTPLAGEKKRKPWGKRGGREMGFSRFQTKIFN